MAISWQECRNFARSFDVRMMVTLWKSVECSAKIAMTTLQRGRAAMRLLPIHDLPRLIFLDDRDVANLLILERARQLASSANVTPR
jgi:hypothetical protein